MRAAAIRDDVTLKTMSDDGQRNTMITEVTAQLGLSGFDSKPSTTGRSSSGASRTGTGAFPGPSAEVPESPDETAQQLIKGQQSFKPLEIGGPR